MIQVLRSVLAIIAGLLVGMLAISAGEMVGHHIAPPPPGLNIHDSESVSDAMKAMPAGAFVAVLVSWGVGTFAGAWVAAKVAGVGKIWHGMVIGGLFFAGGLAMVVMIPHPLWVVVIGLAEFLPLAYLAGKLASGGRRSPALEG